jgi:phage host-nuclease inhibitor protein Gam
MSDFESQESFDEPELSDFLASAGQPEGFVFGDANFAIKNDDEALWAVKQLARAQRRLDEVNRQAKEEIERIKSWAEYRSSRLQPNIDYFTNNLSAYLLRVREDEQDGRKSLDFPDGVVTSRAVASKVAVADIDAFVSWAEQNGHEDWLRVKREADLSGIKKVVDFAGDAVIDPTTGEIVEGLSHVPGGTSVSVKITD